MGSAVVSGVAFPAGGGLEPLRARPLRWGAFFFLCEGLGVGPSKISLIGFPMARAAPTVVVESCGFALETNGVLGIWMRLALNAHIDVTGLACEVSVG